ncbi:hypothetical protein, partial [Pectinatus frisingensis]|uniref:hypothetical protein n=1 Tax=Pectinatus frisingensis TaxID=865 RepID=UPI001E3B46CA
RSESVIVLTSFGVIPSGGSSMYFYLRSSTPFLSICKSSPICKNNYESSMEQTRVKIKRNGIKL